MSSVLSNEQAEVVYDMIRTSLAGVDTNGRCPSLQELVQEVLFLLAAERPDIRERFSDKDRNAVRSLVRVCQKGGLGAPKAARGISSI